MLDVRLVAIIADGNIFTIDTSYLDVQRSYNDLGYPDMQNPEPIEKWQWLNYL